MFPAINNLHTREATNSSWKTNLDSDEIYDGLNTIGNVEGRENNDTHTHQIQFKDKLASVHQQ